MALEPITRKEKIIAGENLEPITRLEKFLKEYGGSSGSGGGGGGDEPDFYVNVVDASSDAQGVTYLTLDATAEQIFTAYESGKHVFINILGLANAQVQKNQSGALYAIVFMPQTEGISGITKLGVYYLEAKYPKWKMSVSYISTTTE